MPVSFRLLSELRSSLAEMGRSALACAVLRIAVPSLEAACGGPTHETTSLRVSLGELCEALEDHATAIRAHLGVTQECADLLLSHGDGGPGVTFVNVWNNLGFAFKRAGRLVPAAKAYQTALQFTDASDVSSCVQNVRSNRLTLLSKHPDVELDIDRMDLAMSLFGGNLRVLSHLRSQRAGFTGMVELIRDGTWFLRGVYGDQPALAPGFVLHEDGSFTTEALPLDPYHAASDTSDMRSSVEKQVPKAFGGMLFRPNAGICFGCGSSNPDKQMKKCSQCKQVSYCSAACQRSHWPTHKLICLKVKLSLVSIGRWADPYAQFNDALIDYLTALAASLASKHFVRVQDLSATHTMMGVFERSENRSQQRLAICLKDPCVIYLQEGAMEFAQSDAGWSTKAVQELPTPGSSARFPQGGSWSFRVRFDCELARVFVFPIIDAANGKRHFPLRK